MKKILVLAFILLAVVSAKADCESLFTTTNVTIAYDVKRRVRQHLANMKDSLDGLKRLGVNEELTEMKPGIHKFKKNLFLRSARILYPDLVQLQQENVSSAELKPLIEAYTSYISKATTSIFLLESEGLAALFQGSKIVHFLSEEDKPFEYLIDGRGIDFADVAKKILLLKSKSLKSSTFPKNKLQMIVFLQAVREGYTDLEFYSEIPGHVSSVDQAKAIIVLLKLGEIDISKYRKILLTP